MPDRAAIRVMSERIWDRFLTEEDICPSWLSRQFHRGPKEFIANVTATVADPHFLLWVISSAEKLPMFPLI